MSDLDKFLMPDADTPIQEEASAQEQTPISLDDAFGNLVKGWKAEQDGAATSTPTPTQDPSTPEDVANSQAQQQATTPSETGESAPQKPEDVEALRAQLLADKDAQLKLAHARLQELSQQYQSLKNVSQQLYEQTTQIQSAKPAEVPDKVKELKELYPDIADAMEKYIEWKVGNPQADVDRIATEKAAFVQQQVQELQKQQHVQTILAKHPDMHEVIRSEDAKQWFNALDPVAKRGAQYVINYGTASDVISLLDQYKASKSSGTSKLNNSAGVNNLAHRVVNAMGVKSAQAEPTPVQTTTQPRQLTEKEAFDRLVREYNKDPNSIR